MLHSLPVYKFSSINPCKCSAIRSSELRRVLEVPNCYFNDITVVWILVIISACTKGGYSSFFSLHTRSLGTRLLIFVLQVTKKCEAMLYHFVPNCHFFMYMKK